MEDVEDARICYDCIDEPFLCDEVRSQGKKAKCTYCGKTRKAISLEELADRIHGVLDSYFYLTPTEPGEGYDLAIVKEGLWKRAGKPVDWVIQVIAGVDEMIAKDVQQHLSDRFGCPGEDNPYDHMALYEGRGPLVDDWDIREHWDVFKQHVCFRARFFGDYAQSALSRIFGNIETLRTWEDTPAIREIKPADEDRYFYRARVASDRELKDVLGDPVKGLGPPPSRKARAGRMNATGISVFYGARDEETCITEVRAPVGSYVIIGRFEIIRPVRLLLLDFDTPNQVHAKGSLFDLELHARVSHAAFLERLVREISQPIAAHDEEFGYLPTQVVSEYFASCVKPRLDGIMFRSSQRAGEGWNVVLFNHARRVEPYDLPKGTDLKLEMAGTDDCDDHIAIFEELPPAEAEKPKVSQRAGFYCPELDDLDGLDPYSRWRLGLEDGDDDEYLETTLRLDVGSVRALKIVAVNYKHQERTVRRIRKTKTSTHT